MQTTPITGFPARRLAHAREALARAHRQIVRAAKKANQMAPSEPTLVVVAGTERWQSQCTGCHCIEEGICGGTCMACRKGFWTTRPVVDLDLTWEKPRLAGWEFLAVIEPLIGGNLIKKVPHATVADGELARWERGGITCDHCATLRSRLETFILRSDGSDPIIGAGVYKQVGRNCLSAFLGGLSPMAILCSIQWPKAVEATGDDGEGGGWGGENKHHEIVEFMAWVASSARLAGFVTRAKAKESGVQSTSEHVDYLLSPPSPMGRTQWEKARAFYQPNDTNRAHGLAALNWARNLAPTSDYLRNLSIVAQQPACQPQHAGILASALASYERDLGIQMAQKQRENRHGVSTHQGTLGEKARDFGRCTIERVFVTATDFGPLHIHTFRDANGNALVWKTGKPAGQMGDKVDLRGTVKGHSEFRGEKQTDLARCSVKVIADEIIEQHPTADEVTA